jgi:hypothetical protein
MVAPPTPKERTKLPAETEVPGWHASKAQGPVGCCLNSPSLTPPVTPKPDPLKLKDTSRKALRELGAPPMVTVPPVTTSSSARASVAGPKMKVTSSRIKSGAACFLTDDIRWIPFERSEFVGSSRTRGVTGQVYGQRVDGSINIFRCPARASGSAP